MAETNGRNGMAKTVAAGLIGAVAGLLIAGVPVLNQLGSLASEEEIQQLEERIGRLEIEAARNTERIDELVRRIVLTSAEGR